MRKPSDQRACRNPSCRVIFRPERGLLNGRFCRTCTFIRKKQKAAQHKLRKKPYGLYPKAGFLQQRRKLSEPDRPKQCGMCAITAEQHLAKHGIDLHLDHVIPARFVTMVNGNPHDDRNLMWLCKFDHGRKRKAEERLREKEGLRGFILALQIEGWDMANIKSLLVMYHVPVERLPF